MSGELSENYKSAFDGRLGFGDSPALILVDFVKAYFDDSCPLFADVDDALESALRILAAARHAGLPVVYSNVVYQEGGADGGVFYRKAPVLENFVIGNPMGAWADGVAPAAGELVVSKQYPSAFFGTSLADDLHQRGIDTLIITGLTTSGCVRATCVDTMCHGFNPIVVADACGDRHASPHDANLFDMNAKYSDVLGETEVIRHLEKIAK